MSLPSVLTFFCKIHRAPNELAPLGVEITADLDNIVQAVKHGKGFLTT